MSITIAKAKREQFAAINKVMEEGQRLHANHLPHIFKDVSPVMPKVFFEEILKDLDKDILVAMDGEAIVGFALLRVNQAPPFESVQSRTYTYIDDFGVLESFQGNGVGRKLLEACKEWAKEKNSEHLELTVWDFNERARSFYEALGLTTVTRRMSLPLKDDHSK